MVLGTAGFGLGMTAAPPMLIVMDPVTVVVVLNAVALLTYGVALYETRRHLPVREMTPISLAGLAGVPFGVYFLGTADASALRVSITVAILLLAAAVGLNFHREIPKPALVGPLLGFSVGVMLVALGIGGPLVAVFLLMRGTLRQAMRASMAYYFILIQAAGVGGFIVAGLFTLERAIVVLLSLPCVMVGFWISTLLVKRIDERTFRRVAVGVIVATSLVVLGREVVQMLGGVQ